MLDGFLREPFDLILKSDGHRAASETGPRETCAESSAPFEGGHELVKFGCRDLEVVAETRVACAEQTTQAFEIAGAEHGRRGENTFVLRDDVPGAWVGAHLAGGGVP